MIVLDTNVLSEMSRKDGDPAVLEWAENQDPRELWITSTTVSEIRLGIEKMPPGKRRDTVEAMNSRALISFSDGTLSFETHAATAYGLIVAERAASGRPIARADAQIASCCVASGAVLATRNTGDFEGIEGLELINPFEPS